MKVKLIWLMYCAGNCAAHARSVLKALAHKEHVDAFCMAEVDAVANHLSVTSGRLLATHYLYQASRQKLLNVISFNSSKCIPFVNQVYFVCKSFVIDCESVLNVCNQLIFCN